jgi:hypothetical protein
VDQSNQKRPAESHLTYLDFPETSVRESGYRDDSPAPLTPMNGTGNVPTDFRTILRNRDLDNIWLPKSYTEWRQAGILQSLRSV